MARRGRTPKGEFSGKLAALTTRITPKLRRQLDLASETSGRSLSQEVEHRLELTFEKEQTISDVFGDHRNFAFFRMLAAITSAIHNPDKPRQFWLTDPFQYEQAVHAIGVVLDMMKPSGAVVLPRDERWHHQWLMTAALALEALREAQAAGIDVPSKIRTGLGKAFRELDWGTAPEAGLDRYFSKYFDTDFAPKSTRRKK